MATFLLAFGVVVLACVGLSLGVILGRGPIKGSCGGFACVPGADCAACPNRAAAEDAA